MSKNLTLKGAAFGALVALSLAAVAPASAAGLADKSFVSLTPQAGTEYSVLANGTFDLKANLASGISVSGANLKFLVADTAAVTKYDALNSNSPANSTAVVAVAAVTKTSNTVITFDSLAVTVADGTTVYFNADEAAAIGGGIAANTAYVTSGLNTADGAHKLFAITVATNTTAVVSGSYNIQKGSTSALDSRAVIAGAALGAADVTSIAPQTSQWAATTTGGRKSASDGSYVVNTGTHLVTNDRVLRLVNTGTSTQSVDVTAWVDANDNGLIDDTEYTSTTRTIKFLAKADITPTVSLDAVSSGDSALTARITTSPVLNGDQVGFANIGAAFTRQDSARKVVVAASSWSDTSKTFVATKNLAVDDTTGAKYGTAGVADANGAWADLARPASKTSVAVVVASKVATATIAAHGLRVGDKVTFGTVAGGNGPNANLAATQFTVTSVPSVDTFKFALDIADATLAAQGTGNNNYSVTTYGSGVAIVDRAFAGTYTAQAALVPASGISTLPYWTTFGTAATNASTSKVASTVTTGVITNENVGKTGSGTAAVRKGTTSATVTATVKNSDTDLVGAGVQVKAVVSASTSGVTFKVNGTTVADGSVVYAATDANGVAKFEVTNATAAAANTITLTLSSETVSGDVTQVLTWNTAVYSIVDLNDTNSTTASRLRSANKGANTTFDLVVLDQFKTVADSSLYRLKATVTGRTVNTSFVSLTAGKATLVVADGQVDTAVDTTVALNIQKLVSGTWTTNAVDADVIDWDGAADELATVAIKYYDQTDAIALNADAASTPNTGATAELTPATTTKALAAVDLRTAAGSAPSYAGGTGQGLIAGIVKNSTTAAGRQGAVVTATGAGLLFNAGDVWSIGSISTLTNSSGFFAINVYSISSGKQTVTLTSGAVTTTVGVTYTGASTSTKKLTVTPSSTTYVAGQTVVYNILLTDSNGNPIDTTAPAATPAAAYISVSYDGPGIISGSLPVETDADGKASVRIVTGTADTQNAVLTVKYDQNYDGDFVDTYDLTVASTVPVLVVEPSAVVNVVSHRVYVKFNNSKGEEVTAVIGGVRITKTATYNGYVVSRWIKTPGKVAVKAYVAGDLVKASTVTVK